MEETFGGYSDLIWRNVITHVLNLNLDLIVCDVFEKIKNSRGPAVGLLTCFDFNFIQIYLESIQRAIHYSGLLKVKSRSSLT